VSGYRHQFPDLRSPAVALHLRSFEFGTSRTLSFEQDVIFWVFFVEVHQLVRSRKPDPSVGLILLYTELTVLEAHQLHGGYVAATLTAASLGNDKPPSCNLLTPVATRGAEGPTIEKPLVLDDLPNRYARNTLVWF